MKIKNKCLLVSLISLLFHLTSSKCGIDFLNTPKRILEKQDGENFRMLKEDKWESLRIHMDFSMIENNIGKIDKNDLLDLKEKIMPKTQEVFQKLLKVKRIQNKLRFNTQSCDSVTIPDHYHTEGVDADLVIFVLVDDTGFFLKNKIEAGTIHCLQHQETKRPIAGFIQFKPQLNVNNSTALDYLVWLAVHEVSHILVINNSLYEDFINPETLIPLGLNNVLGKHFHKDGLKVNYIKSPKVLEKAKKHFGCNHIEGVPLEYNGGAGTAGAHWSKKYMNTDYMIGDSYGENLISDISLALFEDSGWYKVDYEMSNLFVWGKNAGCEFFDRNKKCIREKKPNEIDKNKSFFDILKGINFNTYTSDFKNEFCTNFNYPICSTSNVFRGVCKIRKNNNILPDSRRYFKNPYIGGVDTLTDSCPIPIEDKGDQNYYGGSCRVGNQKNINNPSIEKICPECACFMSNLNEINGTLPIRKHEQDLNIKNNNLKKENTSDSVIKKKIDVRNEQPTLSATDLKSVNSKKYF